MNVEVNYLAVVAATIGGMAVGAFWYAQAVFGKTWMKLAKVEPTGEAVWKPMVMAAVATLLTAYVLAHVTYLSNQFFQNSFMSAAVQTAFWLWLGFTAARFVVHDAFEGRRKKLTLLNISSELVTMLVMGAIIGWFGV